MLDLDMGKYGFFVWTSYSAVVLGLAGLIVVTLRANAKHKAALKALQDGSGHDTTGLDT
ncbi:heme exporter protein CcmD [Asticcacaulis sp. AC402]|uniref:heme exporter protein CcmD n=1 Tax=Asticcacaulis sp. AC402 TaxID=1282361 RepID=UPI0003C3F92F|nr:heme exporter protein CcmD [Asticcacaulis sp. AC402]ESQ75709.1 hypothetical protein ABAC402_07025 [Asticcacaulis sp. AC402]